MGHLVVPGDMDMGTGVDMGIGVRGAMLTGVGGGRGAVICDLFLGVLGDTVVTCTAKAESGLILRSHA